jgi:broad specificity phosphatase PhoE
MKITAVLHFNKAQGFIDSEALELAANPSLSLQGFEEALEIAPTIKAMGPFDGMFTSRLARALDTSSVLAMYLDMDFQTIRELGQAGNKEGNKIIMYPGFEDYSFLGWQNNAISALKRLELADYQNILIVSHRPIVGALHAFSKGITNESGIAHVVLSELGNEPIFKFEYIAGILY